MRTAASGGATTTNGNGSANGQGGHENPDADVPPEDWQGDSRRDDRSRPTVKNYIEIEVEGAEEGDTKKIKLPRSLSDVTAEILRTTGGWPKSAGIVDGSLGTLFAALNGGIVYFEKTPALLGQLFDDHFVLDWMTGKKYQSKDALREYLRTNVEQFKAVETIPHFPPLDGHYYYHPKIVPGDGSHLNKFLGFFKPATPLDEQLAKAFVMQLFWGGRYGARPGWLITSIDRDAEAGRGVGKTTFVQKCSELVGGMLAFNSKSADTSDIERRMLTPSAKSYRIFNIDNLKSLGFSWGFLEATITASTIDGREMYVGNGRRANTVTWALTANGATLSRDMAQRCNVMKMARPTYAAGNWDDDINDFIARHRWQIIGDIAAEFDKEPSKLSSSNRWGSFTRDIIGRLPDPVAVQSLLATRATEVDGDNDEKNLVRNALMNVVITRASNPRPELVRAKITPEVLAKIINRSTGISYAVNKAIAHVYTLGITELRKDPSHKNGKFHQWVGSAATETTPWVKICEFDDRDMVERGD